MIGSDPLRQDDELGAESRLDRQAARSRELRSIESPALLEYWRTILLNKWLILGTTALCSLAAVLALGQMVPKYRATASLFIEGNRPQSVTSGAEVYTGVSPEAIYLQTQVEVLKSREIALRVIRQLDLGRFPEFDPNERQLLPWQLWLKANLPGLARLLIEEARPVSDPEAYEAIILGRFMGALRIQHLRNSQLIRIAFEAHEPMLCARVANAVVDAYAATERETRLQTTRNAGEWINSRLSELKDRLDASERDLQEYRESEGMLDPKRTTLGGAGRQLDEMITRLADARTRRAELEAAMREIQGGAPNNYDSVPAVLRNPSVQRAREREQEAQKKLAETASVYGSAHPRHQVAEDDVRAARENTKAQIAAVVAGVSKEYSAARGIEQSISGALAQSKESIQSINRKEVRLASLEREAAANRKLYEEFLMRLRETSVSLDPERSGARFIDRAVAPRDPFRPNRSLILMIGGAGGLFLGAALAIGRKRLDNTVKKIEDIEVKLGQPMLGALPLLRGRAKDNVAEAFLFRQNPMYSESIRTIGTGVSLAAPRRESKVIAITSPVQAEGKSSVSMSLALSLATSQRVLLIEADLRRPSLADRCRTDVGDRKGLVEFVTGTARFEDCVFRVRDTELDVIMSGEPPAYPLDLFSSEAFVSAIEMARSRYDTIIIDCPPVQIVSDALVIGRVATGVVFVVKGGHTPIPLARAGIKRLEDANIPIMGVVLNHHDFKRAERYYGEYSGYGKYYAYGYGYGADKAAGK